MGSNVKMGTERWRRSLMAAGAAFAAAVMASAFIATPAWAGTAEIRRTVWLGGSETQGGTACVQRDIYLDPAVYRWTNAVRPMWTGADWDDLPWGTYRWEMCVVGVAGRKGWYYGRGTLHKLDNTQPPVHDQFISGQWSHPVAGNVELYSSLSS
jgi:hypothetical protein